MLHLSSSLKMNYEEIIIAFYCKSYMLAFSRIVITRGNWRRGLRPRDKGLNYTDSVNLGEGHSGRKLARWAEPRQRRGFVWRESG